MGILKILSDFADMFTASDDSLTVEEQAELDKMREDLKKEGNTELLKLIDEKGAKRRERASKRMAEGAKSQTESKQDIKGKDEGR